MARGLYAVHSRHPNVDQHDVGRSSHCEREGLERPSAALPASSQASSPRQPLQALARRLLVIDDQTLIEPQLGPDARAGR